MTRECLQAPLSDRCTERACDVSDARGGRKNSNKQSLCFPKVQAGITQSTVDLMHRLTAESNNINVNKYSLKCNNAFL